MTMQREAKFQAEMILKGYRKLEFASPKLRQMCRDQGRTGYAMTSREYAREYLGRRQTNAQTATSKKMERMGWRDTEGGGFKKITRRF